MRHPWSSSCTSLDPSSPPREQCPNPPWVFLVDKVSVAQEEQAVMLGQLELILGHRAVTTTHASRVTQHYNACGCLLGQLSAAIVHRMSGLPLQRANTLKTDNLDAQNFFSCSFKRHCLFTGLVNCYMTLRAGKEMCRDNLKCRSQRLLF